MQVYFFICCINFTQSRYSSKGLTNAIIMWYPFGTLISFKILVARKCDRVRFMPLAHYHLFLFDHQFSGDLPENTFNDNDHLADHESPNPRDDLVYPRHTPRPTQILVEKNLCRPLGGIVSSGVFPPAD